MQDLIQGPAWPFAGCEVEFDVVLVGVQPHVQQEGLQLQVAPRRIRSSDRRVGLTKLLWADSEQLLLHKTSRKRSKTAGIGAAELDELDSHAQELWRPGRASRLIFLKKRFTVGDHYWLN